MKVQWCLTLFLFYVADLAEENNDPAGKQLGSFRDTILGPVGIMTTSLGTPINQEDAKTALNKRLIFHEFFMDSMTHLDRERLPPRVVHAKGAGAFGYFEVTHDIKDICKAKVFSEVGKKTPVAVRFSPIAQEIGGMDTSRDARGFAIKFYTEDGNFDIVGLHTPMFVIKDPLFFPSFVHSRKKNPQTCLYDANKCFGIFWCNDQKACSYICVYLVIKVSAMVIDMCLDMAFILFKWSVRKEKSISSYWILTFVDLH